MIGFSMAIYLINILSKSSAQTLRNVLFCFKTDLSKKTKTSDEVMFKMKTWRKKIVQKITHDVRRHIDYPKC